MARFVLAWLALLLPSSLVAAESKPEEGAELAVIEEYCVGCHNAVARRRHQPRVV